MRITKPWLLGQVLAPADTGWSNVGATSASRTQAKPGGGCLLLLPAWFVVMLATAALLDSRLRSDTPLTASTQKE